MVEREDDVAVEASENVSLLLLNLSWLVSDESNVVLSR
jgi:hypothetical protein